MTLSFTVLLFARRIVEYILHGHHRATLASYALAFFRERKP
jgi:hypothetical protein